MKHARKDKYSPHGFLRRPRLGNPMFTSRGRRDGSDAAAWLKAALISLVAAGALAGLIWFIWFCPNFRISPSNIRITVDAPSASSAESEIASPIRAIIDEHVASRRFGIFPQSNIFFFDSRGAEDRVSASFYLQGLEVRRKLPNAVMVAVKERPARAVTVSDGKFWAMDDSGFAVRSLYAREMRDMTDLPDAYRPLTVPDAAATEIIVPGDDTAAGDQKNVYPMLVNSDAVSGHRPIVPGEQAFPASVMGLTLAADSRLTDICQDRVKWFNVRDSFDTVEAYMGDGWRVIMSSSLPFDAQAERLARLLKGQLSGDRSNLDYVDLRWGERVFIKSKDQPQAPAIGQ